MHVLAVRPSHLRQAEDVVEDVVRLVALDAEGDTIHGGELHTPDRGEAHRVRIRAHQEGNR